MEFCDFKKGRNKTKIPLNLPKLSQMSATVCESAV